MSITFSGPQRLMVQPPTARPAARFGMTITTEPQKTFVDSNISSAATDALNDLHSILSRDSKFPTHKEFVDSFAELYSQIHEKGHGDGFGMFNRRSDEVTNLDKMEAIAEQVITNKQLFWAREARDISLNCNKADYTLPPVLADAFVKRAEMGDS